ncbi:CpsD/CapB family tyrosine-protein kinase [Leisingera daeponensis]|uniref:CpsD/CapB family tyrosine-protein kinase n=1 Tax=Leisingera daeponensis TaxID=405746 RepID=A0ABS7NJB4_9RHOB|nr:CpsD/CapB family tyrosine-protein kinase [Leisingera daeponensis]MBY6140887.1 CpsD/CapB family tyrosine-protein kinase [Leisingera daeponensis]
MKHFAPSKAIGAGPLRGPRETRKDDKDGMTEQGFKRFRRRRAPAAATPFTADTEGGSRLAVPASAAPSLLPATLPEPWDRIRQVPFDGAGHQEARLPLVSRFRTAPAAKSFDLLRTRLLHTLKARGWKRVAVTAPAAGCGTTFSAVNLALSLARVPGSRTVLMDMNFRRPGVACALGLQAPANMTGVLSGTVLMEEHLLRPLPSLAVGLNNAADQNAAEILHSGTCIETLDGLMLRSGADVALFDLPPVLEHDDTAAFLPQVDGVLIISDGTSTTAAQLAACEKMLAGHTQLLGVVLNRARKSDSSLL